MALPELVSTLCTFLVLAPLALMPGLGEFLYRPMAMAVAFAMIAAYLLSRTFVPSRCAAWLRPARRPRRTVTTTSTSRPRRGPLGRAFAWWEGRIDAAIAVLRRGCSTSSCDHRGLTVAIAAAPARWRSLVGLGPRLRREFFPEVDAGAFEIYARAPSGTRIEETEKKVARVEQFVRETIGDDLQLIIAEIGVVADLSAAYTPNAGPMDAVIKVQLTPEREHSAQEYVRPAPRRLRRKARSSPTSSSPSTPAGMIRAAMNEGKSSPLNVRISGKDMAQVAARSPSAIRRKVARIDGVVDARIIQRLDYPAVHHRRRPRQGGRPRPDARST